MIYFFYGDDTEGLEASVQQILRGILRQTGLKASDVLTLRPDDENPDRLFAHLDTIDLFSPYKIIQVRNIFLFPKPFRDMLLEYAKRRPIAREASVHLLITYKKDANTDTAKDALFSFLCKKPAEVKTCEVPVGRARESWLAHTAERFGLKLDNRFAGIIIASSQDSPDVLVGEVQKLALYLGASPRRPKTVAAPDIEKVCGKHLHQNIFKLIDALGEKNSKETLRMLFTAALTGEDPIKLTGLFTYAFRSMLAVKDIEGRPLRPQDASAITGLQPWQLQQYRRASSRFSLKELKRLYEQLLAVDYKTKTGQGNPRMLLERFVLSCV